MTDAPLTNSPDARTADGTLKDQGGTPSIPPASSTTPPATTPPTTPPAATETPAKTADTDKSLVNDEGKPPAAQQGAPETYADFRAPEGYTLDPTAIAKALPIFKEMNLSQDSAQRLIDLYAEQTRSASEAPVKLYAEMQKEWRTEAATRFGKAIEPGGAIFASIAKAIDGHLPPSLAKAFRSTLDFTGVGSHPDFIEGLSVFAKLLSEGTSVRGSGPSPEGQKAPGAAPLSVAQAMYPHLPSAGR